jgi:hypothetical protein
MEMAFGMILLGLGLLALLYFALQLKMEIRHTARSQREAFEQIQLQMGEQRSRWIETTRRSNGRATLMGPGRAEVLFPEPAAGRRAGTAALWTDSTRGKAIEMVRRGESSQAIASALSVARPEVEFLMRLEAAARKG